MDKSPRQYVRYVCCLFVVCCKFCRGNLITNNVTGYGGNTTVFTCSSSNISPGDNYFLRKDGAVIYRSLDEGTTVDGKYNAAAEVGEINLNILNTNISDAGEYTCDHNFIDASGTVSVAFRPENVIATTSQQDHMWKLSVSAYKVFPLESNITSASCLSPADNTVAVFQRENQVVNTNNEEQYLYDIFWNGTIDRTWSGDAQCNITIVVIDTIVRTISVSFQDTTTSTSSTPNLTSEPDSTSEPFPESAIIGIVVGVVVVVVVVVVVAVIVNGKQTSSTGDSGQHNDDKSNSSVSQIKMDVMSTEKSDVDHKELPRNNSGNETSRETIPPRRTIHDENQGNGQSIRANALPPIGYSKVSPDDNQLSGDPDKNTPNNEANYTPRPQPILPNIR